MKVKLVFIGGFDKKEEVLDVKGKKRYSELLESIGINPETVVIVKGKTPIPTDALVEEGEVKVIRVISGGLF